MSSIFSIAAYIIENAFSTIWMDQIWQIEIMLLLILIEMSEMDPEYKQWFKIAKNK